jgi:hypothetical protein
MMVLLLFLKWHRSRCGNFKIKMKRFHALGFDINMKWCCNVPEHFRIISSSPEIPTQS